MIEAKHDDGDFREGMEESMEILRDADWSQRRGNGYVPGDHVICVFVCAPFR